jgi:magnesium transporter
VIRAQLFRAEQAPAAADLAAWPALCADDDNLLWVDVLAPTEAELARVTALLHLADVAPRAVEVARHTAHQPAVRPYPGHYVVTALSIAVDEAQAAPRLEVAEVDAFVGRNFLVSLHEAPLPFMAALQERAAANRQLGRHGSSYLLYVLLDTLVGQYERAFRGVEQEAERLEERLLREPGRGALARALVMTRHLNDLRHLLSLHRQAFGLLVAADSPVPASQAVEAYLRDLLLRLGGLVERLDHLRDVVTGSYGLYLTNIASRTNQQLRVLTFLSAVLLPMTVLTGVFGTNFALSEYARWEPFYLMLGGLAAITGAMLAFFRWRRWL